MTKILAHQNFEIHSQNPYNISWWRENPYPSKHTEGLKGTGMLLTGEASEVARVIRENPQHERALNRKMVDLAY